MPRILYVMRHAETLFNIQCKIQGWCDSPLTARGIEQAKAAGRLLAERGVTFTHAYCSTAERCSDTLEIATQEAYGKAMPYERLKGLRECGFGQFEGKDECLNPPAPHGNFFVPYGGESDEQVDERMRTTLTHIMERPGHDCVLAVSHAGSSIHFFMNCSDHSNVRIDTFCNCMIYEYEYENGTFVAKDFLIPDLAPLEQPGMPPQLRHIRL